MKATRRRLTKRNAPRRLNTGRASTKLLLVEKVILHARPVNGTASRGGRRVGVILPGILAQLVAVRGRKGAQ